MEAGLIYSKLKKIISKNIGDFKGRVTYVDHHLSHQLYAECMRDWNEFISVSIDGGGEEFSTVINVVQNGLRTNIGHHKWPNSWAISIPHSLVSSALKCSRENTK